ncbi:mechanosensitive ion channel domain-containing protein [Ferrimonas lipolytica]|uniref:Mechanosensitive ion channel n=1 Tax=Ferrimonas lipolytica TaxID=2724191 RepID=A0A6H1UK01_9GAMM|nr:mechanosensitive ion channel domain-containing protein [Ferrimonas lipolytica]QIZ78643.1 mechanosensitive ion channel [Ferrimonas lipolytica]
MWRFLLLCLITLLTFSSYASGPLSLERRLNPFGVEQSSQVAGIEQWQQQISQVSQQGNEHNQLLLSFSERYSQLQQQLQQPLPTKVELNQDLSQQSSMTHNQLQQLKTSSQTQTEQLALLRQRLKALPDAHQQANQQLRLTQQQPPSDLNTTRENYYNTLIATLTAEQQALPRQIQLLQLQQRLVQSQQADLELRLTNINRASNEARRQQSRDAISSAHQGLQQDLSLSRLSEQNANYARALAQTNGRLEQISSQLLNSEQLHQSLSMEYNETREQLNWDSTSAVVGQALLQRLNRLERSKPAPLNAEIVTQSRLNRYDYEQQREQLQRQLQQTDRPKSELKLLQRQYQLLQQLLQANEQLTVDFSRLQLQQSQLLTLNERYQTLITENLLWLPNAQPANGKMLIQVMFSIDWLLSNERWKELEQSRLNNIVWWSWWLLLTVVVMVVIDLSRHRVDRLREQQARFVGNVTQDKFRASLHALGLAAVYSVLLPAPLWAAGVIFFFGEGPNFAHAFGAGLLGLAVVAQFYSFLHHLSLPQALLVAHFRRNAPLVATVRRFLTKMHLIGAPLVFTVAMTHFIELPQLPESLGRTAFIGLCLLLSYTYRRLAKYSEQYHHFHGYSDTNRALLETFMWFVLMVLPLVSIGLALQGFYYSAQQALGQAQLTVTVGATYMLTYLMVKRRILIERRRLQLAQARAKRAELLAQREKDKTDSAITDVTLDLPEEQPIDLDTISTQSLGLIRSVLLLAFAFSLVALWAQTHPAVFSFLDSITLYSSTQVVGGIEQQVPITFKSLIAAALIGGFSYLIARNLPGLLELVILQRLELSPGTGFAISTVSKYLVYLFGTIATFSALGLSWNQMQWLIAALTVGLGFGLQEIFANFISGLIILFEKPIRIGDTVTIRDLTGTVSKIQIRATTIVDWDRKEIIVPNKAFITEQLVNWSLSDAITRVILKVSVARESDPALVDAVLHQAVSEAPLALQQPAPEIFFDGFTGHTQNFEVRVYADEMAKRWPLRHDLHMRINTKFKDAGIVMAYPQMDLHINNEVKDTGLIRN